MQLTPKVVVLTFLCVAVFSYLFSFDRSVYKDGKIDAIVKGVRKKKVIVEIGEKDVNDSAPCHVATEALGTPARGQSSGRSKPPTVCPDPCQWNNRWGASAGSAKSWDHAFFGGQSLQFMQREGLSYESKILEVAVGSFSSTVKFVENLKPGNVYGIDISDAQNRYGYRHVIEKRGMETDFPFSNLRATADFAIPDDWPKFDFAWSKSLWTHMPLSEISLCLRKIMPVLKSGGVYYTTAFIVPPGWNIKKPRPVRSKLYKDQAFNKLSTYSDHDPFHYSIEQIQQLAEEVGVEFTHISDEEWGSPRMQHMLKFRNP